MFIKTVQLLLCLSLVVVGGPLAPCKLADTSCGHSKVAAMAGASTFSGPAFDSLQLPDDDSDCDGSCWCSVHLRGVDGAFAAAQMPTFGCIVAAGLIVVNLNLSVIRTPYTYALDPPGPSCARSLPLLI